MHKDRLGRPISLIYRYSQIFFNAELKKYNLGSGQYIFLLNLFENNGISQEKLADIAKFDKATTARAIAKLVKEDYVIRKISPIDKRAYNLYTTNKAQAIKKDIFALLDCWNQSMLGNLEQEGKKKLLELVGKVENNILRQAK